MRLILFLTLLASPAAFAANFPSQVDCEIVRGDIGTPYYFQTAYQMKWPTPNFVQTGIPGTSNIVATWLYENPAPSGPASRFLNIDVDTQNGDLISRATLDLRATDETQTLSIYIAPLDMEVLCQANP